MISTVSRMPTNFLVDLETSEVNSFSSQLFLFSEICFIVIDI